MKSLPFALVLSLTLLTACGGSQDSMSGAGVAATTSPAENSSVTAELSLNGPVMTPSPEAPFGRMYGNYRVVSCANYGRAVRGEDHCGYSVLAVFAPSDQSQETKLSLRRRTGERRTDFLDTLALRPANISRPEAGVRNTYEEDGDISASLIRSLSSSGQEYYREITFRKVSDTQYTLTFKHRSFIDRRFAPERRDEYYELTLQKL